MALKLGAPSRFGVGIATSFSPTHHLNKTPGNLGKIWSAVRATLEAWEALDSSPDALLPAVEPSRGSHSPGVRSFGLEGLEAPRTESGVSGLLGLSLMATNANNGSV